ncbi:hypothetical protein BDP27DRAFT_1343326 [Rhodocollybia butyracea]|uniref:Uncharacterized protein n=1 Tax=Rhodocollybia butyracea TaxID=206335 RepID=A0A9P5P990_9AGAR|nr:hypothetical protein BDP27DRAFT_1343326 [Rhodocollybia butyracea]
MTDIFTVPSAFFNSDAFGSTSLSTPTYSSIPNSTEISLDAEPLSRRRVWRTRSPAYGLNDRIEGSVRLNGPTEHIGDISINLEGNLLVSVLGDGGTPRSNLLFLSRSITLPLSRHPLVGDEYPFTISIPSEITVQDVTALTPPSFYRCNDDLSGEIVYSLKISMTRRGSRVSFKPEPNETKIIPILYFPKTRPMDPPLSTMPKLLLDHDLRFTSGPSLSISEHIDSFPLKPHWSSLSSHVKHPAGGLESFKNCAIFSLPAPQSFVSGERIPFFLSLVFPHSPAQGAMYTKNIKVSLWKQLTVRPLKSSLAKLFTRAKISSAKTSQSRSSIPDPPHNKDDQRSNSPFERSPGHSRSNSLSIDMYGPPVTQRWYLKTGRLETCSEYSEGVHLLWGSIDAGYLGQGCSWKVGHLAQLQYFFEIEIDAPAHMEDHLPSFKLQKVVELTTDCWETMNRELQSTGGLPAPALGLGRCLLEKELNQNM